MPRGGSKPGEYRGGRKKGTPNKVTTEVKAALTAAFEQMGGVEALVKWGKENPGAFYPLWCKMLPTEIRNPDGEALRLAFGADVRKRLAEVDGTDDDDPDGGRSGEPGAPGGAESADVADPGAPAAD